MTRDHHRSRARTGRFLQSTKSRPDHQQPERVRESNDRRSGWHQFGLLLILCGVGWVWCIVLPWYATLPSVNQHLLFLDEKGIDPSAMFYTELDVMDEILENLESERLRGTTMKKVPFVPDSPTSRRIHVVSSFRKQ